MTTSPFRRSRHVIPRWRPVVKALEIGELGKPSGLLASATINKDLRERLEAWRRSPNLITASEVVEAAIIEDRVSEGVRAARSLLLSDSGATNLVKWQAGALLRRAGYGDEIAEAPVFVDVSSIRRARLRTRLSPHDAFAWSDLALAYVSRGKNDAAARAIVVAVQLAPHDRYILRSAARFFLHTDDPEQAHDLIKRNEGTCRDPWLMAAEIAIAPLAARRPFFLKAGKELLAEGGIQPKQISELSSAIGTDHLREGNRRARQLFSQSLVDPTGNSLAQAEWASPQIENLVDRKLFDRVQDSSEAQAFASYWSGDFKAAIKNCGAWHSEESYSSRPYLFGSCVANTLEDFDTALKFADDGLKASSDGAKASSETLKANSNIPELLNSKAFALASLNRSDEAAAVIVHAFSKFPSETAGTLMATSGMILIRAGESEEGIKRYRNAISYFKKTGNQSAEAAAFAYLAHEMARAELPDAAKIFEEAKALGKNLKHIPELPILFNRTAAWLGAVAKRKDHTTA